jgi:hypothetical protein
MNNKKIIKTEGVDKNFSSFGGIFLYERLCERLGLFSKMATTLPANLIEPKTTAYDKFKALCLGFVAGADSLEDMDKLACDVGFKETLGHVNASNTYGEYLRSFSGLQTKQINEKLIETALELRNKMHKKDKTFILDLDSTACVQHGEKMEGVGFNYKNLWCLDSIQAYDQYGFQYHMDVRAGNTYSSNNSETIIHEVFKRIPVEMEKYFRGDSAFGSNEIFKALEVKGVKFVISMKENVYSTFLNRIDKWEKSKLLFHDKRETEVGHWFYTPKASKKVYRITALRSLKADRQRSLFQVESYDYFVCISNIGHHEMSNEKLIKFYRKRGQAENFIKELKYGFDQKHFPCQKLNANKIYGLISAFAYNLMRYTAFILNKQKTHYSKMIRFRMVRLACQVVSHARYAIFRFNNETMKEVSHWQNEINREFSYGIL